MLDFLALFVFSTSAIIVSIFTSLSMYSLAVSINSPYAVSSASLFGLLSLSLLQFILSIINDTMDASYLCYIIDIDRDIVRPNVVHSAFYHLKPFNHL